MAVWYLTGNTHPHNDTICKFRRENFAAVGDAFLQMLQLARQMGVRAIHGEAPFIETRPGKTYSVELRASGGLTIQSE